MVEEPIIRPAHRRDYPAIARLPATEAELALVQPGARFPWTPEQIALIERERAELTVIEVNGEVCGFADLYYLTPSSHAFIGNVVIGREQRGHGYGRRLLSHMLGIIFDKYELPEARISVFADNHAALALYQAMGFQLYDEEARELSPGECQRLLHLRQGRHRIST